MPFCIVKYVPLLVFAPTRKTPYSEKFPAYCFVFKDCITAEYLWLWDADTEVINMDSLLFVT